MISLGYSTNGLTGLDLISAINAVKEAGYAGVELSFHNQQFNPYKLTNDDLIELRNILHQCKVKPACIATPTIAFLTDRPHEPSLICVDQAGRKQRIHLIKRGVEIAKILGAPIVSFGSGFIRDDHVANSHVNPRTLLIDSICECLENIEDITLVIEPEPGMYIETVEEGVSLVKEVNSQNFKLHLDLCHLFCTEKDYIQSIITAIPYASYLHVSDTTDGHNLKMLDINENIAIDFSFASYLLYCPISCDFLFLSKNQAIYFYDRSLEKNAVKNIEKFINKIAKYQIIEYINYNDLYMGPSQYDAEINTYVVSIPRLSFYVLDRSKPILKYLRGVTNNRHQIIDKMIANTLTGKVHFHEIPGTGQIDFKQCFKVLQDGGFTGFASVELYHHIATWENALNQSFKYLKDCI